MTRELVDRLPEATGNYVFGDTPNDLDVEQLRDLAKQLQHEQLRLRDEVVGLQHELSTLKERYSEGDLQAAVERADASWVRVGELELEIHGLRLGYAAERASLESGYRSTTTWKIGSLVLAPVRWFRR